jgi:hypothetical protein
MVVHPRAVRCGERLDMATVSWPIATGDMTEPTSTTTVAGSMLPTMKAQYAEMHTRQEPPTRVPTVASRCSTAYQHRMYHVRTMRMPFLPSYIGTTKPKLITRDSGKQLTTLPAELCCAPSNTLPTLGQHQHFNGCFSKTLLSDTHATYTFISLSTPMLRRSQTKTCFFGGRVTTVECYYSTSRMLLFHYTGCVPLHLTRSCRFVPANCTAPTEDSQH